MPELKHRKTGAVVSVSDETAKKLAHDYEPIKPAAKPQPDEA